MQQDAIYKQLTEILVSDFGDQKRLPIYTPFLRKMP